MLNLQKLKNVKLVCRKEGQEWAYLQQQLNDTVGPAIFDDFKRLGWDKLDTIQVSILNALKLGTNYFGT